MSTLLLRLAGPMQAWGVSSRFTNRTTQPYPSKSGVLGLLAASLGRRRTEPIEDLLRLQFGLRVDQTGDVLRDFQTARTMGDPPASMPLSNRYYLTDAVFLAAVQGEDGTVRMLDNALRSPAFPLYLGRRSCPPMGEVTLGVREDDLRACLEAEPWQASPLVRRRAGQSIDCRVIADAEPDDVVRRTCRDMPQSFDPEYRLYSYRHLTEYTVTLPNPEGRTAPPASGRGIEDPHDPFAAAVGGL